MKNLILTLILIPYIGYGQFERNYQNGSFNSVKQTSDGGFIAVGNIIDSLYGKAGYILKTNLKGDTLWSRSYNNHIVPIILAQGKITNIIDIIIKDDNNFIVTGEFYGNPGFTGIPRGIWTGIIDHRGEILWDHLEYYGTELINGYGTSTSLTQTIDGGYAITGNLLNSNQLSFPQSQNTYRDNDIILTKYNSNGFVVNRKTYGDSTQNEFGYSIKQTVDSGYIIAGATYSGDALSFPKINNPYSAIVIKTDINGDTLWTRKWNGDSASTWTSSLSGGWVDGKEYIFRDVELTDDGGYILTGTKANINWHQTGFIPGITGHWVKQSYLWVVKIDYQGNEEWSSEFQNNSSYNNFNEGHSIQQNKDGDFIITGKTLIENEWTKSEHNDVWLIKINNQGHKLWEKYFGNEHNDIGYSVQQTINGGYVIAGANETDSANSYGHIIYTDENGEIINENNSIFENQDNGSLKLYPNPMLNSAIIDIPVNDETFTLRVFDIAGNLLRKTENINSNHSSYVIKREGLTSGTYFIELSSDSKTFKNKLTIN